MSRFPLQFVTTCRPSASRRRRGRQRLSRLDAPPQHTPFGQNGVRASCSCSPQCEGPQGVQWGTERKRHDSEASLSERERRTSCRTAAARCWPRRSAGDKGFVLELAPGHARVAHFCFVHKRPEEQRLLVRSDLPALKCGCRGCWGLRGRCRGGGATSKVGCY